MRPIKFRAWDGIGLKMWNNVTFDETHIHGEFYNGIMPRWETNPIMQFTGLHDKNGKEIYEGDKVIFYDQMSLCTHTGVIEFRDGSFCIVGEFTTHYRLIDYDMEVIGNIYEEQV